MAKETSRFVYKWMLKGGDVEVKVYDSFLGNKNVKQKSFRAFGLEIGCVLTFEAEDAEHQKLLRRHFLRMKHKRDMCQKLIGTYSGTVWGLKEEEKMFYFYFLQDIMFQVLHSERFHKLILTCVNCWGMICPRGMFLKK